MEFHRTERERVFIISIRKDIDNGQFAFPEPVPLEKRLRDYIDLVVDEKYYLSENMLRYIVGKESKNYNFRVEINDPDGILKSPIRASGDKPVIKVGCIQQADLNHYGNDQMNRVYSIDGESPTIMTKTGGGRDVKIIDNQKRVRRLTQKECFRLMGFSDDDFEKARTAINCRFYNGKDRSGSQLYKQAGNSIVVDVLMVIFGRLFDAVLI